MLILKTLGQVFIMSLIVGGCVTGSRSPSAPSATKTVIEGQPQPSLWFQGRPEEAFHQAKDQNKLVFLYWGAVWCPPCNELKSEVFSKPSFAKLMENFIAVYLDGDTDEAQLWGERLQASGYPTVLVLAPDRSELYRLNVSLNEHEFAAAIEPFLQKDQNFPEALLRLEAGNTKPDDWKILAFASWEQLPSERFKSEQLLKSAKLAADACPANLVHERAMLAANLLTLTLTLQNNTDVRASVESNRAEAKRYLDAIFLDESTIQAARPFILNSAGAMASFLYKSPGGSAYQELKKRWLSAALLIANNPKNSVDTRLEAWNPSVEFYKLEPSTAHSIDELRKHIQKAAHQADQDAKTAFERHAAISSAAYLLRQVGDFNGARKLLETELAQTDTPWYYFSSLASLEEELNNTQAAQAWAAKARETARGSATKIQWITSDLLLNSRIKNSQQKVAMLNLTKEFYETTTGLRDGFSGRNWARVQKVQSSLRDWRHEPEFQSVFATYSRRCRTQENVSKENCQRHFAELK